MDIHSTIERMLNMTVANGASVQEAETAAAAVRKLLDKHGLTIGEVRARRQKKNQGVEFEWLDVPWNATPVWARSLAVEIASGADAEGRFLQYSGQDLRDWKQSYLCAAALRIGVRLRAARQRTDATAALIVCKEEAVNQVFEQMFANQPTIPVNALRGINSLSGAVHGDEAGRRACLDGRPLPVPPRQQPLGFLGGGGS